MLEAKIKKTVEFFENYWPVIFSSTGILMLTIGLYLSAELNIPNVAILEKIILLGKSSSGKLAYLGAILSIIGNLCIFGRNHSMIYMTLQLEKSNSALLIEQKNVDSLNHDYKALDVDVFNSLYKILWTYLAYLSQTELKEIISKTERITVYTHTGDRFFKQLGRYSIHPRYKETGRKQYYDDEGSIGEAWLKGQVIIKDLPDPESNLSEYESVLLNDWNMNKGVVNGLKMKSRCFIGFDIKDSRNVQRVGIILFESTHPNQLEQNIAKLEQIAEDKNKILSTIIEQEQELRRKIKSSQHIA